MDPNATLAELLTIARQIIEHESADPYDEQPIDVDPYRFAELTIALHEWLARGGFLPDVWKRRS